MQEKPNEAINFGNAVCAPHLLPYSVCSIQFLGNSLIAFSDIILPRIPPSNAILRCEPRRGQAMEGG